MLLNVAEFILYVVSSGILSQGTLSCNLRVYQEFGQIQQDVACEQLFTGETRRHELDTSTGASFTVETRYNDMPREHGIISLCRDSRYNDIAVK